MTDNYHNTDKSLNAYSPKQHINETSVDAQHAANTEESSPSDTDNDKPNFIMIG